MDRHPRRQDARRRDQDRALARRQARGARDRPAPRARHDRAAHPHLARAARQSRAPDRRLPARRHQRRRQDRDRDGARRLALRRRAERGRDQHVRVPGGAHRLEPQGLAARLRGLRRGRRAHRGGAPQALLGGAARRGGEGAPRRDGALLPGLRQGHARGRRGPRDRLQEHGDPADHERRAPRRSRSCAPTPTRRRCPRHWSRRSGRIS